MKIINADWLSCRAPKSDYKIFANIPFNLPARPGELTFDQWLGVFKFYETIK